MIKRIVEFNPIQTDTGIARCLIGIFGRIIFYPIYFIYYPKGVTIFNDALSFINSFFVVLFDLFFNDLIISQNFALPFYLTFLFFTPFLLPFRLPLSLKIFLSLLLLYFFSFNIFDSATTLEDAITAGHIDRFSTIPFFLLFSAIFLKIRKTFVFYFFVPFTILLIAFSYPLLTFWLVANYFFLEGFIFLKKISYNNLDLKNILKNLKGLSYILIINYSMANTYICANKHFSYYNDN